MFPSSGKLFSLYREVWQIHGSLSFFMCGSVQPTQKSINSESGVVRAVYIHRGRDGTDFSAVADQDPQPQVEKTYLDLQISLFHIR